MCIFNTCPCHAWRWMRFACPYSQLYNFFLLQIWHKHSCIQFAYSCIHFFKLAIRNKSSCVFPVWIQVRVNASKSQSFMHAMHKKYANRCMVKYKDSWAKYLVHTHCARSKSSQAYSSQRWMHTHALKWYTSLHP